MATTAGISSRCLRIQLVFSMPFGTYHSYEVRRLFAFGYSWSPGNSLKRSPTRSERFRFEKASTSDLCTALKVASRPLSAMSAFGWCNSSSGILLAHDMSRLERKRHFRTFITSLVIQVRESGHIFFTSGEYAS